MLLLPLVAARCCCYGVATHAAYHSRFFTSDGDELRITSPAALSRAACCSCESSCNMRPGRDLWQLVECCFGSRARLQPINGPLAMRFIGTAHKSPPPLCPDRINKKHMHNFHKSFMAACKNFRLGQLCGPN